MSELGDDRVEVYIGRARGKTAAAGFDYRRFDEVTSYDITSDMLEIADPWSVRLPFSLVAWRHVAPDAPVIIEINGSPVLTGLIDDSERGITRKEGSFLQISGRDRGGRLVDESCPLFTFNGLGIQQLAEKVAGPWFNAVTLQNATNRRLVSGKAARQARVSREPAIDRGATVKRKVSPGESRSQVIEHFLEKAGLVAFSSADGRSFVVGKPNYEQEPQFAIYAPRPESKRPPGLDAIELRHKESSAERYARITVIGTGAGDKVNSGKNTRRRAVVRQGPNPDGTGASFIVPKDLIVTDDDLHTGRAAQERAEREMRLRESAALSISAVMAGHSQSTGGAPAIWACDKLVRLIDEEIEARGNPREFLITRVQFTGERGSGQQTALTLVPKGMDLRGIAA